MKSVIKKVTAILGLLSLSPLIFAVAPFHPNLVLNGSHWTISAYQDDADDHYFIASVGVCFFKDGKGTNGLNYIWVSDTFPDFAGRAFQEGDAVKMLGGNTGTSPSFQDAMQFEIVTSTLAAGHWYEWMPTTTYAGSAVYANSQMVRDGECPYATPEDALNQSPLRLTNPGQGPLSPQ